MNRYLAVKRGWANVKLVKTHLKIRVIQHRVESYYHRTKNEKATTIVLIVLVLA
jgi:hypothetical protein